jgi:hypothetical protein
MTFRDFLAEIQTLRIEELRVQTEDYLEAVISKAGLDPLHKVLTAYFGSPFKPEGHAPSAKAERHAKPYGGIRKDQTMYFREEGDLCECALLWPWGNGVCITVKIIQSKSSDPENGWKDLLENIFIHKF